MHKEDGITKLIDGEIYYKFDYANFLYEELQKKDDEIDKYKNVIDKALYWLSENTHYTSLKVDKLVLDENANLKELLELLEEVE